MDRRNPIHPHHAARVSANGRDVGVTLNALKHKAGIKLSPEEHRRNLTVEGVPLNHPGGRRFWLGETMLEGAGFVEPCGLVEKITGKAIAKHLINRGGPYCKILEGGVIRVGNTVRNAS